MSNKQKQETKDQKTGRRIDENAARRAVANATKRAEAKAAAKATKRAVALKYDSEKGTAPIITAVGKGQVADKIIELAENSGVARVEDELQANALSAFDAGAKVPKFLYDLVAEVLLFIEEADTQNQNNLYHR